jgi:hypothetical protein
MAADSNPEPFGKTGAVHLRVAVLFCQRTTPR